MTEEVGMVPAIPGGSYLLIEKTMLAGDNGGIDVLFEDKLTPGHHWKFQTGRHYAEFTLTVSAQSQAELHWGALAHAAGVTRFQWNSKTYPGDPVGWRQMMTDIWSGWGKKY